MVQYARQEECDKVHEEISKKLSKIDEMHEDIGYIKGKIDSMEKNNSDWWSRFMAFAAIFVAWIK